MNMESQQNLVGERFHPTDLQCMLSCLRPKIQGIYFPENRFIAELNFYDSDPWDLPSKSNNVKAIDGDWFFFHRHGEKIRRTSKSMSGSYKINGKPRGIMDENSVCIGRKTYLSFTAKEGTIHDDRFSWVMHEYSDASKPLPGQLVLCRLIKRIGDKSRKSDGLVTPNLHNHISNKGLEKHNSKPLEPSIAAKDTESGDFNSLKRKMTELEEGQALINEYLSLDDWIEPSIAAEDTESGDFNPRKSKMTELEEGQALINEYLSLDDWIESSIAAEDTESGDFNSRKRKMTELEEGQALMDEFSWLDGWKDPWVGSDNVDDGGSNFLENQSCPSHMWR